MGKSKKRTASTIITMLLLAAIILVSYYYLYNRTEPLRKTTEPVLTEVEKLINKDFELNYPGTPREVVKVYSSMLKSLYSGLTDDEIEALAYKIRELYDEELIKNNPQGEYIKNLYSEIAAAHKAGRRITNYLLADKSRDQHSVIDGREYVLIEASYTIQERGKYSQAWKFLLRKNDEGKWKILGWEIEIN